MKTNTTTSFDSISLSYYETFLSCCGTNLKTNKITNISLVFTEYQCIELMQTLVCQSDQRIIPQRKKDLISQRQEVHEWQVNLPEQLVKGKLKSTILQ